jgi:hypothetical protein
MRKLFILLLIASLFSCANQRKALNSWMGQPKQRLIMSWGPPSRTTDDGAGGEVLIYAHQVYVPQYGYNWWDYKMMYVSSEGKIYHWRTSREQIPPQQIVVSFR